MALDPLIKAAFGSPPEGVVLNENQTTKNNAIVIILLSIATISVVGRLIARGKYGPGLSLDDYAIVVALVLVAATAGMVIASAFLVGSYPVYFMITMGLYCSPLSHYWTQFKGTTGTCINVGRFFFILAIINLITDVILLLIPVPEILRLHMKKDKKIAVCGILGLGGFVCIASAVRVHYLKVFSTATDFQTIAQGFASKKYELQQFEWQSFSLPTGFERWTSKYETQIEIG
ncbi:hypothetical protein CaCOL14_010064 [Colletotrichum acutatum]